MRTTARSLPNSPLQANYTAFRSLARLSLASSLLEEARSDLRTLPLGDSASYYDVSLIRIQLELRELETRLASDRAHHQGTSVRLTIKSVVWRLLPWLIGLTLPSNTEPEEPSH